MADLLNTTQDVTLFDNESSNYADITDSHELKVYVGNQLATTDAWEQYVKDNKGFAVSFGATVAGKDLTPYMQLKNPSGSGKNIIIKSITMGLNASAGVSTFYLYKTPTITADGTGLTENNLNDLSVTATAQAFSVPTVSAYGSLIATYILSGTGISSFRLDSQLGIYIRANSSFLIAVDPDVNNMSYAVNIWWAEDTA
jgi:hypothetical protein